MLASRTRREHGGDRGEGVGGPRAQRDSGRSGLAIAVPAPAGHRVIGPQPAAVIPPRSHQEKGVAGRRLAHLVIGVVAPALQRAIGVQPTAVLLPHTHPAPRRIGRHRDSEGCRGIGCARPVIRRHRDRRLPQGLPGHGQRLRIYLHGRDSRVGRGRRERGLVSIGVGDNDGNLGQAVHPDDHGREGRDDGRVLGRRRHHSTTKDQQGDYKTGDGLEEEESAHE